MKRALRLGFWIMSALLGLGALVYAFFAFVIAPTLRPGQQITLFTWSSPRPTPQPKLLPSRKGDVILVGELRKTGRAVANARLVFLFQDLFRSDQISTDANGRFEFRLPPGTWQFFGPVIVGNESGVLSYTFNPAIATPSPIFDVGTSSTDRTIHIRIVDGHAGPGDL